MVRMEEITFGSDQEEARRVDFVHDLDGLLTELERSISRDENEINRIE